MTLTRLGHDLDMTPGHDLDTIVTLPGHDTRTPLGHHLDITWTSPGHYLDTTRTRHDLDITTTWTRLGHNLDMTWAGPVQDLDMSWMTWTSPGHHLDMTWTLPGHDPDTTWTSLGHDLDITWTRHGLLVQTSHCSRVRGSSCDSLLPPVRRQPMGRRRVWQAMDVPSGWVQILRGPRPPSQQWPRVNAQRQRQPQTSSGAASPSQQQRPRQSGGSHQHSDVPRVSKSPDEVSKSAFSKVARLQAAIASLDENDQERSSLQQALQCAQQHTVLPPIDQRIADCAQFIERAKKRVRIAEADVKKAVEAQQIPRRRACRCREASCQPSARSCEDSGSSFSESAGTELPRRSGTVEGTAGGSGGGTRQSEKWQEEIQDCHPPPILCPRLGLRSSYAPHAGRRATVDRVGDTTPRRVARGHAARRHVRCNAVNFSHRNGLREDDTNVRSDGDVRQIGVQGGRGFPASGVTRSARYGLRGVRVGEASNPGPVHTRQARKFQRSIPVTQVDVSSDDEVLDRPNRGRHVVPRTNSEVPTTVPASSYALVAAGLCSECEFPVGIPRVAEEPETTVPASPSALVVVGRAVDVPLAILDALKEDLEPSTEVTEFGRLSPSVRVEVASNWRESNDRVAQVAPLSLGRVEVDRHPASGSSSTHSGVPAMHEDLRSMGGSSGDETISIDGWEDSLVGEDDDMHGNEDVVDVAMPRTAAFSEGFESIDFVDPRRLFENRASILRSVPKFLHSPFKNALKMALEECLSSEQLRQERGWKLRMLLPRMLLHRPPGGGLLPKSRLVGRFEAFSRGEFVALIS